MASVYHRNQRAIRSSVLGLCTGVFWDGSLASAVLIAIVPSLLTDFGFRRLLFILSCNNEKKHFEIATCKVSHRPMQYFEWHTNGHCAWQQLIVIPNGGSSVHSWRSSLQAPAPLGLKEQLSWPWLCTGPGHQCDWGETLLDDIRGDSYLLTLGLQPRSVDHSCRSSCGRRGPT